jgi:hypothetical protein
MAVISVNPLNLVYKQYDQQPASVLITFSNLQNNVLSFGSVPDWLSVFDITAIDSKTAKAYFRINSFIEANPFPEGSYSFVLDVFSEREFDEVHGGFWNEGTLNVNLEYTETNILSVSPENIFFNYTQGGALPENKVVYVDSENTWSVVTSAAWISASISSGANNANFNVIVDPFGLSTGTQNGTIAIDDGTVTKIINITFVITDENTADNYLYASPNEMEFIKNIGSFYNSTKNISLNSSENWNAVSSEAWLLISKLSGSSGSDQIIVSLDTDALEAGVYAAEIEIIAGTIIRKTYVALHLGVSIIVLPDSNSLYFADDNVELKLSSENENSYLEVDFKSATKDFALLYKKKAAYIHGTATLNVGKESINIIKSTPLIDIYTNRITSFLKAAVFSFTGYEKNYFTSVVLDSFERNTLFFLNGKTPEISNKLTYIPKEITVSRVAVIALSIYKTTAPGSVLISGAITKEITINEAIDTNIYTAIINLSNYNLNYLDVLVLNFDSVNVTVRIREEEAESVLLVYENEWQLPEILELTGGLIIEYNADFSTQKIQKTNEIHEKIYAADPSQSFSLETGFVESAAEVSWLKKILYSKQMYLFIEGKKIEVIPTFKSLETYKTRENQKNFRLTFKKSLV